MVTCDVRYGVVMPIRVAFQQSIARHSRVIYTHLFVQDNEDENCALARAYLLYSRKLTVRF